MNLDTKNNENSSKNISDKAKYFYIKNIKKWIRCPSCKHGKMTFNKKKSLWLCEDCGYNFSENYYLKDCAFWFCDKCQSFLNNQEGFDNKATKHICHNCGYENETTLNNIKSICSDCGKILLNPEATLCMDCKQTRIEKAKDGLKIAAGVVAFVGAVVLSASADEDDTTTDYTPLPNDDNDDEVYGLGEGNYPTCNCGAEMTEFDGWAWYTCPECRNKVRIIDGKETWHSDIFGKGKKELHSDFELADFCRGGDLTED